MTRKALAALRCMRLLGVALYPFHSATVAPFAIGHSKPHRCPPFVASAPDRLVTCAVAHLACRWHRGHCRCRHLARCTAASLSAAIRCQISGCLPTALGCWLSSNSPLRLVTERGMSRASKPIEGKSGHPPDGTTTLVGDGGEGAQRHASPGAACRTRPMTRTALAALRCMRLLGAAGKRQLISSPSPH